MLVGCRLGAAVADISGKAKLIIVIIFYDGRYSSNTNSKQRYVKLFDLPMSEVPMERQFHSDYC